METKKVLAINSFSACGKAGLNVILPILGNYVLPVPSLLLSGIGNISGSERFVTDFEAHLNSTLKIADAQNLKLIVYVGYLSGAQQVEVIARALQSYSHLVDKVVVDPVCGDQGKPYVDEALITAWSILIQQADMILPNVTEVGLLAGYQPPIDISGFDAILPAFVKQFPLSNIVVTSLFDDGNISNQFFAKGKRTCVSLHRYHARHYSGTGDAFASWFIHFHYFRKMSAYEALQHAGDRVSDMIAFSSRTSSNDLLMPDEFTKLNKIP